VTDPDLPPEPSAAPQPPRPVTPGDVALRVAGGLVAVVAAVQTAILELLLSTFRIAGQLTGVSVVLTVVANVALARFARRAVGSVWAVALPAAAWLVVMMAAATRTTEGDLLLAGNNWVGPVMIFAGSVTFAVAAVRMILKPSSADRLWRG
jgi:hypothetical protein